MYLLSSGHIIILYIYKTYTFRKQIKIMTFADRASQYIYLSN